MRSCQFSASRRSVSRTAEAIETPSAPVDAYASYAFINLLLFVMKHHDAIERGGLPFMAVYDIGNA